MCMFLDRVARSSTAKRHAVRFVRFVLLPSLVWPCGRLGILTTACVCVLDLVVLLMILQRLGRQTPELIVSSCSIGAEQNLQ